MVVCHQDPVAVTPEYLAVRDELALLVRVPSWSATDACVSLVRQACDGARIAAVLATHEVTRQVADRIRAEAGLIGATPIPA